MQIDNDTRVSKTDNFVETVVDDELVLLHIDNGQFYSLKDTGRAAWEMLDANPRFGDLVAAMGEAYEVDEAKCRTQLQALMGDLAERTLVAIG